MFCIIVLIMAKLEKKMICESSHCSNFVDYLYIIFRSYES